MTIEISPDLLKKHTCISRYSWNKMVESTEQIKRSLSYTSQEQVRSCTEQSGSQKQLLDSHWAVCSLDQLQFLFFCHTRGQKQLSPMSQWLLPLTWNPLNPYGTFLRPLSQLLSDTSSSTHILFTCSLHATHRPIASMKRKTSHPFHCHVTPGAVHINKWVSLLCICLYIPHDGFQKKEAMHFLWQSCQTPSSNKKQYITRLFTFHYQ